MISKGYINHYDPELTYHYEDLTKFIYFSKNYITPKIVNEYFVTEEYDKHSPKYNYSLLDRGINTYVNELFDLFDSISFEYMYLKFATVIVLKN